MLHVPACRLPSEDNNEFTRKYLMTTTTTKSTGLGGCVQPKKPINWHQLCTFIVGIVEKSNEKDDYRKPRKKNKEK